LNGAAIDPTVVKFKVKNPNTNVITEYTYGTDAELVKDSTGNYHVDVSALVSGYWYYRFFATGTGESAEEHYFEVRESQF
jgi:hypothetical protein